MKRTAALAALVLGLVPALVLGASPATAMASARGSVPGPTSVRTKCPTIATRPDLPPPCCGPVDGPKAVVAKTAVACGAPVLVFDMHVGSSTATEVRGQRLRAGNELLFRGRIYVVKSVRSDHFTLDLRGKLFVNHGRAIHNGIATVLRGRPA
jgi:hypothetical protein